MKYINWFLNLLAMAIILISTGIVCMGLWYLSIVVGVSILEVLLIGVIWLFVLWRIYIMVDDKKYRRCQ